MKSFFLLMLLISTATANAQSLKDALYGGKLKTDSNTVLRKGDDLSSKIDTSQKKPVEPEKMKPVTAMTDLSVDKITGTTDSPAAVGDKVNLNTPPKDNNKIWKEFTDSVISTLKQEVMNSKKIKKGDYFVIVDYEIGLDGKVTITNVIPTPENKYISEQVKERLSIDTPQLNPVMGGNGKPRKVVKRTNFTITKD